MRKAMLVQLLTVAAILPCAVLAAGTAAPDANKPLVQIVHIPAPQDTQIADLGVRLNGTYLPFGQQGHAAQERQAMQDSNASHASPQAVVQRTLTKSSHNYVNTYWDLVDAVQTKSVDISQLKDEDLPKDMKGMNAEQRANYVNAKAKERTELQAKVRQLNQQRDKFIAEATAKQQGSQTLGSAIKQAIREQAGKKNYTFKSAGPSSDTSQGLTEPAGN